MTNNKWIGSDLSLCVCCPACGREWKGTKVLTFEQKSRGPVSFLRCRFCKSFFSLPSEDLSNETTHIRSTSWGNLESGLYLNNYKSLMFESVLKLIQKYVSPPAKLVDVGCSFGGFIQQAQRLGYSVAGFDLLPEAIHYLKESGFRVEIADSVAECILHSDVNDRPDVISVLDCNYYWSDQPKQLADLRAYLADNGILVMRVVDKSWLVSVGWILHGVFPRISEKMLNSGTNDHKFSMPVDSLVELLTQIGFQVVYSSPIGAMHSIHSRFHVKFLFFLSRLIYYFLGKNLGPGALIVARKAN